jgi:hypothetical protein
MFFNQWWMNDGYMIEEVLMDSDGFRINIGLMVDE